MNENDTYTDGNERYTPDDSMVLNLSADEREFLLEAVAAGTDHLSHQELGKDESELRKYEKSIISKLMQSQGTGGDRNE